SNSYKRLWLIVKTRLRLPVAMRVSSYGYGYRQKTNRLNLRVFRLWPFNVAFFYGGDTGCDSHCNFKVSPFEHAESGV
ncbi:MAG: hypothetical protein L6416_01650, partial [Candidatus Omnitrophica bacterium]|nr:hypothetical protein [Candidatus Omnitrophota bacterium]